MNKQEFNRLAADFPMSKDKALRAMHEGHKIAHRNFTDDEWMMLIGSLYAFEDGCLCEPEEFWKYRTDESWETGWKIYKVINPAEPVQKNT